MHAHLSKILTWLVLGKVQFKKKKELKFICKDDMLVLEISCDWKSNHWRDMLVPLNMTKGTIKMKLRFKPVSHSHINLRFSRLYVVLGKPYKIIYSTATTSWGIHMQPSRKLSSNALKLNHGPTFKHAIQWDHSKITAYLVKRH